MWYLLLCMCKGVWFPVLRFTVECSFDSQSLKLLSGSKLALLASRNESSEVKRINRTPVRTSLHEFHFVA